MTSQADWVKEFDEMERNHGWIPEHKERVKDFIQSQITLAQQRTEKKWRSKIKEAIKSADSYLIDVNDELSVLKSMIVKKELSDLLK